jgi:hypothetical protein
MQICSLNAQYKHINVFQNLTNESLLVELVKSYKTNIVLDYSIARDTLFSKIDGVNDSLECIYTGMKLYMPPGQDPTNAVYLNGIANGINTEHVYPQGKGATGIGQSDMHHLYPSRIKVNSDRADFPMGEIPDAQTKIWYLKETERSTIPTSNKDLYSEGINGKFEPRESVKGNLARSIFYFYTMYKDQANAADPNFFNIQKADLCQWHYDDPVDEREWIRNQKISEYQGDKLNPFVLDCSLISRAYCNNISQACQSIVLSSTHELSKNEAFSFGVYPNPSFDDFYIKCEIYKPAIYHIYIHKLNGERTSLYKSLSLGQGNHVFHITEELPRSMYIISVENAEGHDRIFKKLVKL